MSTFQSNDLSLLMERGAFEQEGYIVLKNIFTQQEVQKLVTVMHAIHADGPNPAAYFHPLPPSEAGGDILKQYPRIIHPHKINETAMHFMIHPRVMKILAILFQEEPLAVQSMFYFKPPTARGQSLHQDNFFLRVEPGTCIAAWVALDAADEENGGLVVVPQTNHEPIQCPHPADQSLFFTNEEVNLPEGASPIPITLEAGDVLFFNGNVIHGSYPNRSQDRWRRSFICHYTGVSTLKIGTFYDDLYTGDGRNLRVEVNTDGGPCGTTPLEIH